LLLSILRELPHRQTGDEGICLVPQSLRIRTVAPKPHSQKIAVSRSAVNQALTKITDLPFFFKDFAQVRPAARRHFAAISRQYDKLIRPRDFQDGRRFATRITIMTALRGNVGFTPPSSDKANATRRRAGVALCATVALALSLAIAATAVSIGMASAHAPLMQILYRS
jgi:hypothetical protein